MDIPPTGRVGSERSRRDNIYNDVILSAQTHLVDEISAFEVNLWCFIEREGSVSGWDDFESVLLLDHALMACLCVLHCKSDNIYTR